MFARKRIPVDFGWTRNKDKEEGYENSVTSVVDIYAGKCSANWACLKH